MSMQQTESQSGVIVIGDMSGLTPLPEYVEGWPPEPPDSD